jgi:hypothetical protein
MTQAARIDVVSFLRAEGEPIRKEQAARELAMLSKNAPQHWQRCTEQQWTEAIEAAVACGAVKSCEKGVYLERAKKEPALRQVELF